MFCLIFVVFAPEFQVKKMSSYGNYSSDEASNDEIGLYR